MHRRLVLVAIASLTPSVAMAQMDCDVTYAPPVERLLQLDSANVGYYSSHSLTSLKPNPAIRRVVFLIHGLGGDAAGYYGTLAGSACGARNAGLAPNIEQDTILIAPHFRSTHDNTRPAGYHYWIGDHWEQGSASTTGAGVSSMAVLDTFIGRLTGSVRMTPIAPLQRRFPNLEMIVVAGHSGGGQLAHRYAGTNAREGTVDLVQMRYVVSAPSSFLYLDDRRPYTDYSSGVGDPYQYASTPIGSFWLKNPGFSDAPMCATYYNDWKFGLEDLNNYSSAVGAATIRQRLLARRVTVLVGTQDTLDDNLDETCPARLQGENRLERASRFLEYLDIRFPLHHHTLVEVPGATHFQDTVFKSPAAGIVSLGAAALFVD